MIVSTETSYPIVLGEDELEIFFKAHKAIEGILAEMRKYECEILNNPDYGDVSLNELIACRTVLEKLYDNELCEMY